MYVKIPSLEYSDAKKMRINDRNTETVSNVTLLKQHSDTFAGKLYELSPKASICKRTRKYCFRPHLKNELDTMSKLGVITMAGELTHWVRQFVIRRRKDDWIRSRVDPREILLLAASTKLWGGCGRHYSPPASSVMNFIFCYSSSSRASLECLPCCKQPV